MVFGTKRKNPIKEKSHKEMSWILGGFILDGNRLSTLDCVFGLDCVSDQKQCWQKLPGTERLHLGLRYWIGLRIGSKTVLIEITWDWKAPSWIVLLDRIAYWIRNSVDRNYLRLKGSILDGLDHVVGEVEGEERLVELETIVNCPHLCNFSSFKALSC